MRTTVSPRAKNAVFVLDTAKAKLFVVIVGTGSTVTTTRLKTDAGTVAPFCTVAVNVHVDVCVTVGAVGFGFDDPFPPLRVIVTGPMAPCGVQATVTGAFPLTPVVLTESGMAFPEVTCTFEVVNSVTTGAATTETVTFGGCPPVTVDTETLVVGFVTVRV